MLSRSYARWPLMVILFTLSLLSGISSVVERLIVTYRGETKPLTWFWFSVWVCFVISAYALWFLEHRELVRERGLNRFPQIKGRFYQVYIELGDAHTNNTAEIIITCQINLRNVRPVPTSIEEFLLLVSTPDGTYSGIQCSGTGFAYLPAGGKDGDRYPLDVWEVPNNPLPDGYKQGHIERDKWLRFRLSVPWDKIIKREEGKSALEVPWLFEPTEMILTALDAFDNFNEIHVHSPWRTLGRIVSYP